MSLSPGTTLAHYEVLELVGRGGMGEVYRAKDSKLGRDVAIKVLPDEFASDSERLARFSREARVLASLNHPNIAAIYGLEQTEGIHYLVLELVPGETLSERVARGPIPLDEALDIALEIAEALQAAHARGVVHRDLKPANIKLTLDGGVKVLDFGLAKALDDGAAEGDSSISVSPTLTRGATRIGVILGTAAYMSPEQAKGRPVDKRADLWAFGAVLYEMLTGRRPFAGDDISDTLAAVLRVDPDWSALPDPTPASIRLLLRRSLEKTPKDRLEDASNFRFAIEQARTEPGSPSAAPRERSPWLRVGVALLVGLLAGLLPLAFVGRSGDAELPPSVHPEFVPPGVAVSDIALSRDGRRLAFLGTPQGGPTRIYVRALSELEAKPVAGTEGASSVSFSPDSEWLILSKDNALYELALGGGSLVKLLDGPRRGAVWGRQGDIVFETFLGGLMRRDPEDESVEPLTTPNWKVGEYTHQTPSFLPDGKAVLFSVVRNLSESSVGVTRLGTPQTHHVLIEGANPKFSAKSGHLLARRSGTLWAAAFDAESLEVESEAVPVLDGVRQYDIAEDGSLLYLPSRGPSRQRTLVWVDRDGNETSLQAPPRSYRTPNISPEGQRIALAVASDGNLDLWVWDVERQILSRVTLHPGLDFSPVFSPDGGRVAFHSVREVPGVYVVAADASAEPTAVWEGDSLAFPSHWAEAPDRLFVTEMREGVMGVAQLSMDQPGELESILRSRFYHIRGALSPDSRFIAYGSNESGRLNVYVRSYPDLERGRWQVSRDGGEEPQWSRDGKEIFFRSPTHMMAVPVEASEGEGNDMFRVGAPSELFPLDPYYLPGDPQTYDVASDGRFLFMKWEDLPVESSDAAPMVLIENWAQTLEALVPTDN